MLKSLHRLNQLLDHTDKTRFAVLSFLSVIVSMIEMVSLVLILPFLAIAADASLIEKNGYLHQLYTLLGCEKPAQFIFYAGLGLIGLYLVRSSINAFHLYQTTRFSNMVVAKIRKSLFEKDIHLLYSAFTEHNSAALSNNIIVEANNIYHIVFPILTLITESVIFALLIFLLLYQNFQASIIIFLFFSAVSLLVLKIFKKHFALQGLERTRIAEENHRLLNETFGNFKFIKLSNLEPSLTKQFGQNSFNLATTNSIYLVLMALPRYIFETLGLIVIVSTVLFLYTSGSSVLSTVGLYVVAFYRLLPSVNKMINSLNSIKFYEQSFEKILDNLSIPTEQTSSIEPLPFNSSIDLCNVSFSFRTKKVFDKISLKISKNDKIAFIGESGSGKTTLINILTTLIYDISGELRIDGVAVTDKNRISWRKKIGYIPQDIYLFDGTVAENIVFGTEHYDESKIIDILKIAKIYDFFLDKGGIHARVGDNAIQLSGGQKQRLGIARALYRDPEVLVLDEATSALDMKTEEEIMQDIYDICIEKTLIIVAHRLQTTKKCDRTIKVIKGTLLEQQ